MAQVRHGSTVCQRANEVCKLFPPTSCCSTQQLTFVISHQEAQEEQLFQEGKGRFEAPAWDFYLY